MEEQIVGNLAMSWREEHITHIRQLTDLDKRNDLETAEISIKGLKSFMQAKERKGLLVTAPSLYQGKEVLNIYQQADLNEAARALVVNSFTAKLVVNMYLKLAKGKPNESGRIIPSKLFTNEEKAMDWLRKKIKES